MEPGSLAAGTTVLEIREKYDMRAVLRRYDRDEILGEALFAKAMEVHGLWEGWADKAGGLPGRGCVDPVEIGPGLLPHIVVIDVIDGGEDFRWRLFGGRHAAEFGMDLTGVRLSDHLSRNASSRAVRALFLACVREAAPIWHTLEYTASTEVLKRAHGVMLPLAGAPPHPVGHLLGVTDWS